MLSNYDMVDDIEIHITYDTSNTYKMTTYVVIIAIYVLIILNIYKEFDKENSHYIQFKISTNTDFLINFRSRLSCLI